MTVTLSDVAKAAGVSQATASRAIHGAAGRTVRPELRDRVLAAARDLKYSADANAQAMARGKTIAIGLIVHDIADPYFSSIASGVAHAAEDHGLVVTLATTDRKHLNEINFINLMQGQRARAIILAGGRYDDEDKNEEIASALAEYQRRGGQVAVIGQQVLASATVKIANFEGAHQLAGALANHGYQRFAILAGPKLHLTARDRERGFLEGAQDSNLQVSSEHVLHGKFTWEGGHKAMTALIKEGIVGPSGSGKVQGVFAVNDVMALGAMSAAREAGLTIGEDVALAGFDDISTLRDVSPGLSTVRLPLEEIGQAALDLALEGESQKDQLGLAPADAPSVEVAGRVILRSSTPALLPVTT